MYLPTKASDFFLRENKTKRSTFTPCHYWRWKDSGQRKQSLPQASFFTLLVNIKYIPWVRGTQAAFPTYLRGTAAAQTPPGFLEHLLLVAPFLLIRTSQSSWWLWPPFHNPQVWKKKVPNLHVLPVTNSSWLWDTNQGADWLEPRSIFDTNSHSCQTTVDLLCHGNCLHVACDSALLTKHSLSEGRRKVSSYEPLAENDHMVQCLQQFPSHTFVLQRSG